MAALHKKSAICMKISALFLFAPEIKVKQKKRTERSHECDLLVISRACTYGNEENTVIIAPLRAHRLFEIVAEASNETRANAA